MKGMRPIRKIILPILIALFIMSGCAGVTDAVDSILNDADDKDDKTTEEVNENEDNNEDEEEDKEETPDSSEKGEGILNKGSDDDDKNVSDEKKNDDDSSNNNGDDELTLQITKVDEEAGIVMEENPGYQMLNDVVEENPTLGEDDDFSMFSIDSEQDLGDGTKDILFLGINRLDKPIKNIQFNFTLGTTDGDYVWEDIPVSIDEDVFGSIKPNHAMPILLEATDEQFEIYTTINEENQVFEMDNFTFDWD